MLTYAHVSVVIHDSQCPDPSPKGKKRVNVGECEEMDNEGLSHA